MMIAEHKKWAVDLSPEEFQNEFIRKFPRADSIPVKDEWLAMPEPNYDLIDSPGDLIVEDDRPRVQLEGEVIEKGLALNEQIAVCPCGKQVKSKVGMYQHQRKCPVAIRARNEKVDPNGSNLPPVS